MLFRKEILISKAGIGYDRKKYDRVEKMKDLLEIREEIDRIDGQMIEL